MTLSTESMKPRKRLTGDEDTIPSSESIATFQKAVEALGSIFSGAARHLSMGDSKKARVCVALNLPKALIRKLAEIEEVDFLVNKQNWPKLSTTILNEAEADCVLIEETVRATLTELRRSKSVAEKEAEQKKAKTSEQEAAHYWNETKTRLQQLVRRISYLRRIENDHRRLITSIYQEFPEVNREAANSMLMLYDHASLPDSRLDANEKLQKKLHKAFKLAKRALKAAQKSDSGKRKIHIPSEYDQRQWNTDWKQKEQVIG